MTLNEITYSETRQVSEGAWIKIGLKATLEKTDNPDEALSIIKTKVSEYHNLPQVIPTNQVDKQKGDTRAIIQGIASCVEIEGENGLKSFELRARNTPGALEIYNKQLATLLNGKPTDKQIAKSHRQQNGKVKLP